MTRLTDADKIVMIIETTCQDIADNRIGGARYVLSGRIAEGLRVVNDGIPTGFCSPGGKASCLHLVQRERCSDCPIADEQIDQSDDRVKQLAARLIGYVQARPDYSFDRLLSHVTETLSTFAYNEILNHRKAFTAPPKPAPAPDALRDAVARYLCKLVRRFQTSAECGDDCTMCIDGSGTGYWQDEADKVLALSAPVPPADGAGELKMPIRHLESNVDSLYKFPVPSRAVAAEPVAWRYKCHDGQLIYTNRRLTDRQKADGYLEDEDDDGDHGPFFWSDETPLYALPPVTGDREAIMALIEKHVGVTMDLTEGEGVLLGVGDAADAILSLRVQPGAGEGEAAWQDMASAPKDGREIEVKYLTDDPRRVRWAQSPKGTGWHLVNSFSSCIIHFEPTHWRPRQAPHSGSEGERR